MKRNPQTWKLVELLSIEREEVHQQKLELHTAIFNKMNPADMEARTVFVEREEVNYQKL